MHGSSYFVSDNIWVLEDVPIGYDTYLSVLKGLKYIMNFNEIFLKDSSNNMYMYDGWCNFH